MFAYEPALLFIVKDGQEWYHALWPIATATIGVVGLAAGLFGWFRGHASLPQRILLVIAALSLIKPGAITDLIGFGLLALVYFWQYVAPHKEPLGIKTV
jgi:TRAP-type uncharacterized transport system fused permease subunit